MNVSKQGKLFALASILLLSACSNTQLAYLQNIQLYLDANQGVVLGNEQITSSKADLIFVKNGQRPIATMALAFIENGEYKWLSNDNVMIITTNGRLTRSIGFEQSLLYVSDVDNDPIKSGGNISNIQNTWSRHIDTVINGQGDFGAQLHSELQKSEDVVLTIQEIEFPTIKIEETVTYKSAPYKDEQWTNTFWFHSQTNQLLQSSQKVSPHMDRLDITYVSRALRLIESKNVEAQK